MKATESRSIGRLPTPGDASQAKPSRSGAISTFRARGDPTEGREEPIGRPGHTDPQMPPAGEATDGTLQGFDLVGAPVETLT